MGERVSVRIRIAGWLVAALIAFAAMVWGIGAWARAANRPEVFDVLPVPESEATRIAIAEVTKREGWSGFVDEPPVRREGIFWHVAVWRTPAPHRPSADRRGVTVDGEAGQVLKYEPDVGP
jgi:hypothetical protein